MPKPFRRLELRLPTNHAVWKLPEGSRSRIVREWLEVGRRLTEIEESLQVVTEKLDALNINKPGSTIVQEAANQESQLDMDASFDKNAFLNHFK
ncbi:MAG TPA: hypothetical protein DD791_09860 [Syntrophomonas sp.]|jgi:hypothetical protein|nr:hypothetical protein [Syntrophomonas sp.]